MKSYSLTILLIAMFMSMAANAAEASDYVVVEGDGSVGTAFTVDGLTYRITEPDGTTCTVEVVSCAIKTGSVTIPSSVTYKSQGYGVTSIGSAFSGCSGLTSITIPYSVKTIGSDAFRGCSSLTSITIPNRVTSIGSGAFHGCSSLTSITIPNSVTSIGNYVFYGCTGLTSVTISESVTSIGGWDFYGCTSLTSITIPNSVKSIGAQAFLGCSGLTSVTIGNHVNSIDNYAFKDCSGLTSITFPNSLRTINVGAFEGCNSLTSVTIPNRVKSIGIAAFYGCNSLTSVTICNGVTDIGRDAFRNCSRLMNISIPDSLTSINKSAFYETYWYNNQPEGLIYLGKIAYQYKGTMPKETEIVIKEGTVGIANHAFRDSSSLTSIIISDGMRKIGNYSFENSGLNSLIIPNSISSIGDGAFYGCTGLTSITIPNGVISIGDLAFGGCSLTSITIPESVTSIGSGAFNNLTTVTINSKTIAAISKSYDGTSVLEHFFGSSVTKYIFDGNVQDIGDYACYNCGRLNTVIIGTKVASIGQGAFNNCIRLKKVCSEAEQVPNTNIDNFRNCDIGSATLHVPAASVESYRTTLPWKDFGTIMAIEGTDVPATGISISPTTLSFNAANQTATLTASVIPSNATNKSVTWTSSNSSVATVNDTGVVTAKANGTATITAKTTDGTNLTATCIVTVSFANNSFITFADAKVKSICVANWDTNGDGELSEDEAAKVTGLGEVFYENKSIISFIELQYFTGLTNISEYAFHGCEKLESIVIPNSVARIDSHAFAHCISLASVVIPNSVTELGEAAFEGCNGLTSIGISNSITSINNYVFKDCSCLTSVSIPANITSIGYESFGMCDNLTSVIVKRETPASIDETSFANRRNATLYVPNGCKSAYKAASYWKDFKIIKDGNDVDVVGISLNQTSLSFNAVNQTATLMATVTPSNATNKEVTWASSNTSVATVSNAGVVTSKGNGTATITATTTDGTNLSATCEVTVLLPVLATGISLNQISLSFNAANQTATLIATVVPSNASNKDVTWTSSNTSVATVSSTGVVTSLANGTAIITAKTTDGTNLSAICSVIVLINHNITISDVGYATFFDSKYDWILPSGLSAQVVTGVSNNKLTYEKIYEEIVPKGTAVMLVGQQGTYTLTATANMKSYTGTNLLHGSDEATMTTGDGYHYKLSYGKTGTTWDNIFGWYWGAQDGAPFQIEGHKAWLVVPTSASIRAYGYSLDDDDATGITDMEFSDENHDIYYDIQGRRISTPANRGIYIKNGKKVVIK